MATDDSTPTNTRMNVRERGGATLTTRRMRAPIIPAASATPTPAIDTSTTATTPKPAKLCTNDSKTNRIPSMDSRFRTGNSCTWVMNAGSCAGSPVVES